jgi:hypothetical protein
VRRALLIAAAVVVAAPPVAHASWTAGAAVAAAAAAKARAMPAGATPTATVSGDSVTVSWAAASIAPGAPVAGYVVRRYTATGEARTIGGGCAGTVSATSCTEAGVPAGDWRYAIVPRHGGWSGAESAHVAVTVAPVPPACPTATPSLTWLSGMESGMSTTAGGGVWNTAAGTASVDSATRRSGAYSLRLAPAGAAAYRGRLYTQPSSAFVMRFAVRLASLPTADAELAGMTDLGHYNQAYFTVRYDAATRKLAVGYPGQKVLSSTAIEAATWYSVEVRFDPRTSPQTADWRIDGVAQPSTTYAQPASAAYSLYWGTAAAATYTANFDDFAVSETASDFPIGDGKVLALKPDGMGASAGASNFLNDDNTALNATSWARLDEVPTTSALDFVKQTAVSSTSYAETTFEDTAEACVRAVGARVVWEPHNTNQANHGRTAVVDGGVERTVYAGDMAANNTALNPKYATVAPATGPWSRTAVNGLRARIGYSTDVTPAPTWHALLLEYDVPR